MAEQNPITRLQQVALGLTQLSEELTALIGRPPANLLWWREEILDVAAELERGAGSRQPEPARGDAASGSSVA